MPQMALLTGGFDDLGCFLNAHGHRPERVLGSSRRRKARRLPGRRPRAAAVPGPALSNGTAGNCTNTQLPALGEQGEPREVRHRPSRVRVRTEDAQRRRRRAQHLERPKSPRRASRRSTTGWARAARSSRRHYHYTWFVTARPPTSRASPTGAAGVPDTVPASRATPARSTQTLPKGGKDVLLPGSRPSGRSPAAGDQPHRCADSVVSVNAPTVRWIYSGPAATTNVKYMSFRHAHRRRPRDAARGRPRTAARPSSPTCTPAARRRRHPRLVQGRASPRSRRRSSSSSSTSRPACRTTWCRRRPPPPPPK